MTMLASRLPWLPLRASIRASTGRVSSSSSSSSSSSTRTFLGVAPPSSFSSSSSSSSPHTLAARHQSTLTSLDPSPSAEREVPTPLLFLSAPKWTGEAPCSDLYANYIQACQQRGFSCLLLDLDPDADLSSLTDSAALLSRLEDEAVTTLRTGGGGGGGGSPFPPVLIARGLSAVVAQQYVSSHPLTALQLVDPPLSIDYLAKHRPGLLPSPLDEFKFHTQFPLRVVWTAAQLQQHHKEGVPWYEVHRIEHLREEEAGESLDRLVFPDDDAVVNDTLAWLEDEVGVIDEADASADPVPAEINPDTSSSSVDPSFPPWFTAGSYTLQPHSRKYPLTLDERDLSESFVRGSGPGGQAINKLSTNVQLVHIPTSTRVSCQDTRSRLQNRELARRRMSRVLEQLVRRSMPAEGGKKPGLSRIDREIEKHRKRKANKRKKQERRRKRGSESDASEEVAG